MATALGKEWTECRDKVVLSHQSIASRRASVNRKLISLLRVPAPNTENFIVLTITPSHARHLSAHAARDALLQHLLETPLASFPHTLSTWSLADLDPKLFTVAKTAVRSHLRHVVLPHFDQYYCARDVTDFQSVYFLTLSGLFLVAIACWLYLAYSVLVLTRVQRIVSTFPFAWCASVAYETAMRRVLLIGSSPADKPAQWSSEVIHRRIRLIRKRVRLQMLHGAFVFALACSVVVGVIVPESVAGKIEDVLKALDSKG
ncbi:hypothetical protein BCR44DRAFT_30035 [Catenaria anguillulae PL171]|uniref:Uncharacterized protein n=1 Tax=Catenaria anguillulae PL171 TaxID=765915 RepID=A0A1Y2HCK0_9FUNG|nr:hypothetical protein BCR44DRAFT_30035 [Catenaria anguillulae PL171]